MEKLNELPQAFYGVIKSGKVVMLPAEDGQWLNKTSVAEAFRALEKQRDALAAENANLKHLLSMIAETGNANFGRTTLYTPATDAYLNAVRAEGVDKAIAHLHKKFEGTGHIGVPVMALESLANQLRAGEPS